ncbi:MAG: MurR/RpiR family transcriptional regulator [Hyphomicrobiaceae bacterium]
MMTTESRENARRKRQAPSPLETRIRNVYDVLPASERKIADLVLDFPGEMAAYNATELAELAGGSKAAVTRLIQRLGYVKFEEARRASRNAQKLKPSVHMAPRQFAKKSFASRIVSHIEQETYNIVQTMEWLDPASLGEITTAIWQAERVHVFGCRNSLQFATHLRWQLSQVRPNVHLLPTSGQILAEFLSDMAAHDVLIVIGFRRRVPLVVRALDIAAANGVNVLYITDVGARGHTGAKWTLRCAVQGEVPFGCYAGVLSLLHFLSVSLMQRAGKRGRERLKAIEQLQDELLEFG